MKQINSESSNITQMTDIIFLQPVETSVSDGMLFIFIAICLSILFLFFLIKFKSPLAKLERYLKKGKVSPREIAHQLAQLMSSDNKKINKEIDLFRFQRQPPDSDEILRLISEIKNDC